MSTLEIAQVLPASQLLDEWHSVMRAAYAEGQGIMWWESLAQLRYSVTHPHSRSTRFMFAAMQDGHCVGGMELMVEVQRPDEPVQVELGVLAGQRGRGVGRALAAHGRHFAGSLCCTTVQSEVFAAVGQSLESTRAGDFLARQGFEIGNVEDRMLLELPWDGRGERPESAPGLVLVSWVGACPDEHATAWAALGQQMEEDVPVGDLTRGDTTVDIPRMREGEERSAAARGWLLVRTMALLDAVPTGYTELMVDIHDPGLVVQESTLVDRAARGHGIGSALKSANLRQLLALPTDLVSRMKHIQTYTAQQNVPMQRLNEQFGFRKVGTLHEVELRIAGDG